MGSKTDIMEDMVLKDLVRLYPKVDGWNVAAAPVKGPLREFSITRKKMGKLESIRLIASFERKISKRTMDAFAASGNATGEQILMVPQGADTALVVAPVKVMLMHSFAFRDKDLIWLRKFHVGPMEAMAKAKAA
ncbi:MAG: hypothetical protein LUQ25_00340 [Methanoregulaceae archaeon]|nr:hypothetical protein [Methanoregulaceae archaeon]